MTESPTISTLRWKDIAELTAAGRYPCVSILLPTTPGPRMVPAEILQLTGLVERAETMLRGDSIGQRTHDVILTRLKRIAREATRQPAGQALGLFVNSAVERSVVLPVSVAPAYSSSPASRPGTCCGPCTAHHRTCCSRSTRGWRASSTPRASSSPRWARFC